MADANAGLPEGSHIVLRIGVNLCDVMVEGRDLYGSGIIVAARLEGLAEPGKVLPTVGVLLGGPAVAAALLLFTRIFKEPLKGIGRASYCVSGSWQEPMVERLSQEQLEKGEICAELPPNGALGKPAEVAAR